MGFIGELEIRTTPLGSPSGGAGMARSDMTERAVTTPDALNLLRFLSNVYPLRRSQARASSPGGRAKWVGDNHTAKSQLEAVGVISCGDHLYKTSKH